MTQATMRGRRPFAARLVVAAIAWMAVSAAAEWARGQSLETSRPRTVVGGTPSGARMDGLDGARTRAASTPLPVSGLRVEWRASTGASIDRGPLVDARGVTYVVGSHGDVIALSRTGAEAWRARTGAVRPGPLALLSDDSAVFVDESGEAVAVRDGVVRWRARFGRPTADETPAAAPLPLEDGGIVVATSRDLAMLDADGHERARATVPEPMASALMSAMGRVVVVVASGAVWTWLPGAPEAARVGHFGSNVQGGAVLGNDHTLLAIVADGTTLAAVDLRDGAVATRAIAPAGGVWGGPPAMRGATATLVWLSATPAAGQETAITVDRSDRTISRTRLAGFPVAPRVDGGAAAPNGRPEALGGAARWTPDLFVGPRGAMIFATVYGTVGGVSPIDGAVELLDDVCPRAPPNAAAPANLPALPAVAGLAPLGPASAVVACRSGTVVAIGGDANDPPDPRPGAPPFGSGSWKWQPGTHEPIMSAR